jgi:hypothetical protein
VVVKPDAYLRLETEAFDEHWFIEVDRSTEAPSTLGRKCDVYRAYWASGTEQSRHGLFPQILWTVPSERRYQVVVDVCARQPADSWGLHRVTLFDDAVDLIAGAMP